ncbi:hypothetical protein DPEC_G00105990 [Dallia pectoralis]|uniref:Uncharacterized protein n=1 Tax=Dallia pectoralis TaxID=75939 RepID=A0ACC2GYT7_DALPE|nr:hypothetical protein DPEC_G00105990 [Dallia pectoralis]
MQLFWSHLFLLGVVLIRFSVRANLTMTQTSRSNNTPPTTTPTPSSPTPFSPTTTLKATRTQRNSILTRVKADSNTSIDHSDESQNWTTAGPTPTEPSPANSTQSTVTTNVTRSTIPPGSTDTAGYVILFFIFLAILMCVCGIYFLRKKSRSYSFDLQGPTGYDHDTPLTGMEHPGTFEPTKEKDGGFECVNEDDPQTHVANGLAGSAGSAQEPEAIDSLGENIAKKPDGDEDGGFCGSEISLTPPTKRVGFSLDLDLSELQLDQSDAEVKEQNTNNNNVVMGMFPDPLGLTFDPVGSVAAFTEINLDL